MVEVSGRGFQGSGLWLIDICLRVLKGNSWVLGSGAWRFYLISNGWLVQYFPLEAGPPWLVSVYGFSWKPALPTSKLRHSGLLFSWFLSGLRGSCVARAPHPRGFSSSSPFVIPIPLLRLFLRFIREVSVYFCFHFWKLKAYFPNIISDSSAELGLVSFSSGVQVGRVSCY